MTIFRHFIRFFVILSSSSLSTFVLFSLHRQLKQIKKYEFIVVMFFFHFVLLSVFVTSSFVSCRCLINCGHRLRVFEQIWMIFVNESKIHIKSLWVFLHFCFLRFISIKFEIFRILLGFVSMVNSKFEQILGRILVLCRY